MLALRAESPGVRQDKRPNHGAFQSHQPISDWNGTVTTAFGLVPFKTHIAGALLAGTVKAKEVRADHVEHALPATCYHGI